MTRSLSASTDHAAHNSGARSLWLFSPTIDLGVFLGSAVISLVLLWIGGTLGILHGETPEWTWVPAVLLVDVAHVYATGFRVYLDGTEFKRRPWLYSVVPIAAFGIGVVVYSLGSQLFWRCLAYLAVFHFVRQQYGWVALYRARLRENDRWGRLIDTSAIYAATIYPLIYWHVHLPRNYWWFLDNDFLALPEFTLQLATPAYWVTMIAYVVKSTVYGALGRWNPGKDVVVVTTAICWYVGIVAFNSDYAFTVTNVIIHGVPYMALVYFYQRRVTPKVNRSRADKGWSLTSFLAVIWILAYLEELVWDRSVWMEKSWLFGDSWSITDLHLVLVPLLAVPQLTHYVLDGFVWRRVSNPQLGKLFH